MKLNLESNTAKYVISSYDKGRIVVNTYVLKNSFVITPQHLITDWPPQGLSDLRPGSLEVIIELAPEVILIGSEEGQRPLPVALLEPLVNRGIGVEIMNTGAACRTYNILTSEGRYVAAALLLEG